MTTNSRPFRPAWVEVDPAAIVQNVRTVRKFVGDRVEVMAVVKADGYGHGLVESARAAIEGGARTLGVAILDEALTLRENGFDAPITVLGCGLPEHAGDLVHHRIAQVVSDLETPTALSSEAGKQNRVAAVHPKVDTGMGRVGCPLDEGPAFIERLESLPHLKIQGVATHFSLSDPTQIPSLEIQINRFDALLNPIHPAYPRHAASSAVTLLDPRAHLDMVRIGLLIYGILPYGEPCPIDLQPALELKAVVTQVKTVPRGWTISYGETFVTRRSSRLAIIPVGYADGFSRRLSNSGHVLLQGKRCPILGRVCMDQFVADVTDLASVSVGDEAVLIGEQGREKITVWDLTQTIDGTPHEIVACLGPRLPRAFRPWS